MDAERVSKFASAVQSIVTALGIVGAGVWALYTFWDLGMAQKAQLDIATAQQQLIDQQQQPVLSLVPKWANVAQISGGNYSVSLELTLKNNGKMALSFWDAAFLMAPLANDSGKIDPKIPSVGEAACTLGIDGKMDRMEPRILRSGQERTVAFFIPELRRGYYMVQLEAGYKGLLLQNEHFIDIATGGTNVRAIEQRIIRVPEGLGGAVEDAGSKQTMKPPDRAREN